MHAGSLDRLPRQDQTAAKIDDTNPIAVPINAMVATRMEYGLSSAIKEPSSGIWSVDRMIRFRVKVSAARAVNARSVLIWNCDLWVGYGWLVGYMGPTFISWLNS